MEPNTKISTETKYSDGKISTAFSGHTALDIAGLSGVENSPQTWSPPHLLIAAVESCFTITLIAVAKKMRIELLGYSSTTEGTIFSADGKHHEVSEIVIKPTVNFKDENDRDKLPQMIKMAKEYCLVARSVRTEIKYEI